MHSEMFFFAFFNERVGVLEVVVCDYGPFSIYGVEVAGVNAVVAQCRGE